MFVSKIVKKLLIVHLKNAELFIKNFIEELHEGLLHIASILCTSLEVLITGLVCESLSCLKLHLSLLFQVAFVSQKQNLDFVVHGFFQFSLPFLNVVETLLRTDVKHNHSSVSLFVVASSDCLVLLLSRSVPELNLDHFVFILEFCGLEVHSDGCFWSPDPGLA